MLARSDARRRRSSSAPGPARGEGDESSPLTARGGQRHRYGILRPVPASSMPASHPSPTDPVLRANPCPEVTDPICRLPLPTLFYRLEAVHLGDLLRIWVRPGTRITPSRQDFQGLAGAHRTPREARCFTGAPSLSQAEPIPGSSPPYKEKRTLPGAPASVSWFDRVAALGPTEAGPIYVSGFRNINLIPFRPLTGS